MTMRSLFIALALCSMLASGFKVSRTTNGEAVEVNPMRKIINMLKEMATELEREGKVEAELFDKALCACEGGEKNLQQVIEESKSAITENTAKFKSGTAETAQLEQEVKDHKASKASAEQDLADAKTLRDKEHKKFIADETDGKANIAALGKAIPAIETGMGGASLMQMPRMRRFRNFVEVTKYLTSDARSGVLAFLDQGSEELAAQSVQAPQSGEILGILKSMKDEMERDLKDLQAEEKKDFNGFQDLKSSKLAEIDINAKATLTKEKRIGALALEISEAKHAVEDAEDELSNAENFLANMEEECAKMEKNRDMRAKMRNEEIKAISEAIKILNDDDALDVFKKALPGAALVQKPLKTYDALIQVTRQHHRLLLKSHSHEEPMSSADAGGAAEKMVKGMIDGMVAVLHDEDVSDEHKKDWCANETEVSHKIEADKQSFIEAKTSEIAEEEDQIATLSEEIDDLVAKVAELDKMVHEMTEQRKKEHQEFVDSFATSAMAIKLIDKAIKRLEKFYSPKKYAAEKKAAKDAALKKAGLALVSMTPRASVLAVQRKAASLLPGGFDAFIQLSTASMSRFRKAVREGVDPVALPDTPSTYEKKESGGVISLMNDFKTDLKTEMTESETEEKFNAKEYVRLMTDAKESRAQDVKSTNQKQSEKATLDEKLIDNKAAKQLTEEELHNIQLYLAQLHAECDFLLKNFEVRHDSRVDDEGGLEEAATIVTEEEAPPFREIEGRYEDEHTDNDVAENFPGTPISDVPATPAPE